ncbi:hypothetical protein KAU33_04465 [Candidatus Dependentiae bacterium]|nr:hypothetical protein [Candidatus Dependentiae bacterium]
MPYSEEAKYIHKRYIHPSEIRDGTWFTVPISHTNSKKEWPEGTLAVIGTKISTGNQVIQKVLVPKKAR